MREVIMLVLFLKIFLEHDTDPAQTRNSTAVDESTTEFNKSEFLF